MIRVRFFVDKMLSVSKQWNEKDEWKIDRECNNTPAHGAIGERLVSKNAQTEEKKTFKTIAFGVAK